MLYSNIQGHKQVYKNTHTHMCQMYLFTLSDLVAFLGLISTSALQLFAGPDASKKE